MNVNEVAQLLKTASVFQANLRQTNPESEADAVRAWYMALDTRMGFEEAMVICATLASEQKRLHPGTINDAYLESIRPPHQQGIGRPHLPFKVKERPRAAPAAIGAPEPVAPSSVPEYTQARAAAHKAAQRRSKAWAVTCPYCHADEGRPCVDGNGRRLTHRDAHPSREDALRKVAV